MPSDGVQKLCHQIIGNELCHSRSGARVRSNTEINYWNIHPSESETKYTKLGGRLFRQLKCKQDVLECSLY